jgi:hypothetical protein
MGKLATCSCDTKISFKHKEKHFKWKGCHHNIAYGMHFAKRFLNQKEAARDIQSYMNLHNFKAGRLVSLLCCVGCCFSQSSPDAQLAHYAWTVAAPISQSCGAFGNLFLYRGKPGLQRPN